jgi:hypothetical protein
MSADFAGQLVAGLPGGAPPVEEPMPEGLPPELLGGVPEGVPAGPMYPSADPAFYDQLLAQVMQARDADHAQLQGDQDAALQQSAMFQALIGGAPMGPGAGQDAQAIGFDPAQLPAPPLAE